MKFYEKYETTKHHKAKFYYIVLRSKKEGEYQNATHFISDIQKICSGILSRYY